jgi:Fe-coproporphyrin III synthase
MYLYRLTIFLLFGFMCKGQEVGLNMLKNKRSKQLLSVLPLMQARSLSSLSSMRYRAPKTVDINVNGVCNLNCKWCWGPVHNAKEKVSLKEWKDLTYELKKLGTRSVVFTGGETLLKKELPEFARYIKSDLGLRTTLSTNGLLMVKRGPSILPYINDVGLPLDGHNVEINSTMRIGTILHFSKVLEAIKFVQANFPRTDLTVRTVAAVPNIDSIPFIGKTMLEAGVNPKKMRWKIYQVSPVGPRKDDILNGDLLITRNQFEQVVQEAKMLNPEFIIEEQPFENSFGRYFHIFPDGETHVVVQGNDGFPEEIKTGNIIKDFDSVMKTLNESFNFGHNSKHGKN